MGELDYFSIVLLCLKHALVAVYQPSLACDASLVHGSIPNRQHYLMQSSWLCW